MSVALPAPPTPAVWDALLAAGGTAAAFDLLSRLDRSEDWRDVTTAAQPTGSNWDATPAGPDAPWPHHLAEWVDGSGVAPELAAANIQTLQGLAVQEALLGDRLEQMGGWAQQYATGSVQRLLQPLERVAAAGGWWCSGLDPVNGFRPMAWGCFKPDAPRFDEERNRIRKYEHPVGTPTKMLVLRVPATVAKEIAKRHQLELPPEVEADTTGAAGEFWLWWQRDHRLPLVITEGAKKAGALLSIGLPTVALPGVDSGAKRTGEKNRDGRRTGPRTLIPEFDAMRWRDRLVIILFDWDGDSKKRDTLRRAARTLARLFKRRGARPKHGICPGPAKGIDDHLVNGGSWDEVVEHLEDLSGEPVLPQLRTPDVAVPAGRYMGQVASIPGDRRLVALHGAMGSGKSVLLQQFIAQARANGLKVLDISHRTSLCRAHSEAWGLRFAERFKPHGHETHQLAITTSGAIESVPLADGLSLCIDSVCETSGVAIKPEQWVGCVVILDEVVAVLRHTLMGMGTTVAQRRAAVLGAFTSILRNAAQVVVADAQLCDEVLEALEELLCETAYLIASDHQPAAGRQLVRLSSRAAWRGLLQQQIAAGRRIWVSTTAKEKDNGAKSIADWILTIQPGFRVLVVDSTTVRDPDHDAYRLAADPDGIAAKYDVVVASPAITAGVSVTLQDHFTAVFVASGGTSDPDSIAQAAARVRAQLPRYLFTPDTSPGRFLQVGNGASHPDLVAQSLMDCGDLAMALLAGSGWSPSANFTGPWLPLWCKFAAIQNRARFAYRSTIEALLQREGYELTIAPDDPDLEQIGQDVGASLKQVSEAIETAEIDAIVTAPTISRRRAAEIARSRQQTPAEHAQLQRHRIQQGWALGGRAPTAALVRADRDGLLRKLRLGWMLTTSAGRTAAADADLALAEKITGPHGVWLPDLVRGTVGTKLKMLQHLGVESLLTGEEFSVADPRLANPSGTGLHDRLITLGLRGTQALGISAPTAGGNSKLVPELPITSLKRVVALLGYKVASRRRRQADGTRSTIYRVMPIDLPQGITIDHLHTAWAEELATESPNNEMGGTPPLATESPNRDREPEPMATESPNNEMGEQKPLTPRAAARLAELQRLTAQAIENRARAKAQRAATVQNFMHKLQQEPAR